MIQAHALDHVGIAVSCIAVQREYYEKTLGAVFEGEELVAEQRVRVAFFRLGATRIELLEPTDPASTVAQFIQKRGEGLHHLAYRVTNIDRRLSELKDAGVRLIDEHARPGAHHMRVAFIHPKSTHGVLTELCEPGGPLCEPG